jgi:signal transduction histidine kinase
MDLGKEGNELMNMKRRPGMPRSRVTLVTIILAAEVFVADLVLPLGLAVWLPYAAIVLISLWAPRRRHTTIVATAATVLIILGHFLSPLALAGVASLQSLLNRALGVLVIWITALLCLQRKRGEETQQALLRLSDQLSRSLDLGEAYPVFAAAVKTYMPYDRIGVVVPKGESLVVALSVAEPPLPSSQGMDWPDAAASAVGWVLAHKEARVVRDLETEQAFPDEAFLFQEGVRATIMLPLLVGGEAVGVFFLDNRTPGAYSQRHLELLGPLAEHLALALQNARLYNEAKGHAEELERRVEERTRELQAANLQLVDVSRHKSEFLANMSHELRTPLNSILGFSELLAQQTYGPLTEKQARYVDNIHTSGHHLLALINDLLDLSKVEAGKLELHPQSFHLREALEAALHAIRLQAEAKRQLLHLQVADDLSAITADPIRVRQALYNLLSNAVKFTPAGGFITVTAKMVSSSEFGVSSSQPETRNPKPETASASEFVEIAVADTGIGIKPEDLSKLFRPFTQLEYTLTKQTQGTGLGLALTKRLVELHRGTIWAESAGEGRGSTFTIWLPLRSPAS